MVFLGDIDEAVTRQEQTLKPTCGSPDLGAKRLQPDCLFRRCLSDSPRGRGSHNGSDNGRYRHFAVKH